MLTLSGGWVAGCRPDVHPNLFFYVGSFPLFPVFDTFRFIVRLVFTHRRRFGRDRYEEELPFIE